MVHHDAFYFANGMYAENLEQLRDVLHAADHTVTAHHITEEKNDYAQWVRHVIGDEILARKLEKCRSVHQVLDILSHHLEPQHHHAHHQEHHQEQHHEHHEEHHHAPPEPHPVHHAAPEPPPHHREHHEPQHHVPPVLEQAAHQHAGGKAHIRDFFLGVLVGILAMLLFLKVISFI